jgi:hypothetical protein
MRKIKLLGLVLAASIFAVSCQKGDAGPAGATGPAGPAGPSGPAGAAGTANVIYSDWTDVTFNTTSYTGTINAAQLTSDILNKGEVKVFVNIGRPDSLSVIPLPIVNYYLGTNGTTDYILDLTPNLMVGKIILEIGGTGTFFPNTTPDNLNRKYFQYRYVLIPGGVKTTSNVDWNNYAQVKSYLHLEN